MTRFEMELTGRLGAFWKKNAEKEIEKMQAQVANNEINTDANGGAYWNSNNRYIPEDCAEILSYTDFEFNIEETARAREAQNAEFLANYRKNHKTTAEERMEAHAAFGKDAHIINIITGERI